VTQQRLFAPGPHRSAWRTSPATGRLDRGHIQVALLPTGAVEQHGPHLPLGVDAWIAEAVAAAVADRSDGVVVAEPLPYGSSFHHTAFPGTITLRPRTWIDSVVDVCRSLAAAGYVPVVVNGHGGNRAPLQVALAELAELDVRAWGLSYFELILDLPGELFGETRTTGHACATETSLLLHLWPEAVDTAAIPAGGTPEGWPDLHMDGGTGTIHNNRGFHEVNPTGVIGKPSLASAEAGARLFDTAVTRVAEAVARIRATTRGTAPTLDPGHW
jgi:creatinine amidohydrolase